MCEPFIRNHQYNYIKQQADAVLYALRSVGDPKIVETVRLTALARVTELFPEVQDSRKALLESVAALKTADDFHAYLQSLEPYRLEFPRISAKEIQKLFPKNKKLRLPDLSQTDFRQLSYLSWTDIATGKMFLVYHNDKQFVGVEGRFTPTNKKSYCFACNRFEELALFSAISKKRPAHAQPDYYKSIGNYICLNGHVCNSNVTDVAMLEKFLASVLE